MADYEAEIADLEIVAGHVWGAVGGDADAPPEAPRGSRVQVRQVDPKRFGIEVAAGTSVLWVLGDQTETKQIELATLRPFKPMDLIIIELAEADESGDKTLVSGQTAIRLVEIGGVNQFTSKNPVPSPVFASLFSAPRPRIRFDTVQTSPSLTMDMSYVGTVLVGTAKLEAIATFGGVAVKR